MYTMNLDGTDVVCVSPGSEIFDPSYSPDGCQIAFMSYRDGDAEIYVMNADGSGQTRLTINTSADLDPRWGPGAVLPVVNAITCSAATPTNAPSVQFSVTFSVPVVGVDVSDFALATTGSISAGGFSVTGAGSVYIVTVADVSGDGTLGINLIDDDSILDGSGTPIGGAGAGNANFVGQVYVIDHTAPMLLGSASRKTHGKAGDFDLNLSLSGITVEPRANGPTKLLFNFSEPIKPADGILSANEFAITNASYSSASLSGEVLTLNLANAVNTKCVTVRLTGFADIAGNLLGGDSDVVIGALYGDVNQSQAVDAADQNAIKPWLSKPLSATSFLFDVDCDGKIAPTDQNVLKKNLGKRLLLA